MHRQLLFVILVLVCVVTGPAAGAPGGDDPPGREQSCFPDDGAEFTAGTEGPQVQFSLHTSLFPAVFGFETDSTGADASTTPNTSVETTATGAFGVEAAGTVAEASVVSLRAGVLFRGADAAAFLTDPFEPFSFVFDYRLTIPAFVGTGVDPEYRVDDVPVSGPVTEAAGC